MSKKAIGLRCNTFIPSLVSRSFIDWITQITKLINYSNDTIDCIYLSFQVNIYTVNLLDPSAVIIWYVTMAPCHIK